MGFRLLCGEKKMKATTLARWERKIRSLTLKLPPKTAVSMYSKGRLDFLGKLKDEIPEEIYAPPKHLERVLWGIRFKAPLMNSAGMFKNGECYEMAARQGAGAYMGGTGTFNARRGNERNGIYLPFAPYPRSGAASNWLGLPNDGDEVNAKRASHFERKNDTPIIWSVMGSPDLQGEKKLQHLVAGMWLYEKAGVDALQLNESCPNTGEHEMEDSPTKRLTYIKEHFLDSRARQLPVIVKVSPDMDVAQIPILLDLLFELGYDGVDFGNTSTHYEKLRAKIDPSDHRVYDYYTKTFRGGISGRPLKEISLELAARAVEYLRKGPPSHEFHVWRTGGIETYDDILASDRAGISMNLWYTGYFNAFAEHGHNVYKNFFESSAKPLL